MRRVGSRLLILTLAVSPLACGEVPDEGEETSDTGLFPTSGASTTTESSNTGASDASTTGDTATTTATTTDDSASTSGTSASTDTSSTTSDDTSSTTGVPSDLPAWCDPTIGWSSTWIAWEQEVLVIMNQRRSEGANCGSEGSFAPAGPLTMQPNLSCAARMHSRDMEERGFFDHTNPDGDGPGERIAYSGYDGWGWGENIAWGYQSPAEVMAGWMSSDGHCSNIMYDGFTEVGVGYYTGNQWTQAFGTPAG